MLESGRIKFFDTEKNWGFVKREGKPDAFLHGSVAKKSNVNFKDLTDDREVSIRVGDGKPGKGPQVEHVELA